MEEEYWKGIGYEAFADPVSMSDDSDSSQFSNESELLIADNCIIAYEINSVLSKCLSTNNQIVSNEEKNNEASEVELVDEYDFRDDCYGC